MPHGVLDKRHCLNQWRHFHGLCELVGNVIDTDSWLGGRGRKHSHRYVMIPKIPIQEKDRHKEGVKWMKWRCWQLGNLGERGAGFSRMFFQLFPVGQKLLHNEKLTPQELQTHRDRIWRWNKHNGTTTGVCRQLREGSHNGETCTHGPSKRVYYSEERVRNAGCGFSGMWEWQTWKCA